MLENWDEVDDPDPKELAVYLDELEHDLGWGPRAGEHLTLQLRVGLPEAVGVDDRGHDLDDYLFPVVSRLGHVRFDAVFATKQHSDDSLIRIAPAARADQLPGPPQVQVRLTASATSMDWKQQLHDACRRVTAEPAPPGAVAVQIRLSVSRRRNWAALWKPAIDALGPILGVADPTRPYRADDDRITSLSIHRRFDDRLGDDVGVEVWWQPLPVSRQP